MTLDEIRLACLKLARSDGMTNAHEAALIVARARSFEEYVTQNSKTLSLPTQRGDQREPVARKG